MNDPYDNHPNHPANQAELVARYGYINPNQFPAIDELGSTAPMFKGIVNEQLDIEEAEKVAQDLANELGQIVTVEVTDEGGREVGALTFTATREQGVEIEF